MCVTQSRCCLHCENLAHEHSIQNYQVGHLDRNRHGGGVLVYVHNCLSYKVVLKGPVTLEFLVLSVSNYFCKLFVGLSSTQFPCQCS